MPKITDLSGLRQGKLIVLRLAERSPGKNLWLCRCDCGRDVTIRQPRLRAGTKSCGCLIAHSQFRPLHGETGSVEHNTWLRMHYRCSSDLPNFRPHYKDRGIRVCERWFSFELFLADMGRRPASKPTLDRRNSDLGYTPENCRWASWPEQRASTVSNLAIHGEPLSGAAVLGVDEVLDIRQMAASGMPRQLIAAMANVGRTAIDNIVTEKTWTHVA